MSKNSVAIITAIGNPLAYKDFDVVLTMFELQVKSIANLKGNFKYYCVSNRHPKVKAILRKHLNNDKYALIEVDFLPPLRKGEQAGHRTSHNYNIFMTDKGCRLISGFTSSLPDNHHFTFFVDCDDWINENLIPYYENNTSDICYVDKGYIIDYGNKKLKPCHGLFRFCGSTIAYSTEFLKKEFAHELECLDSMKTKEDIINAFGKDTVALFFGDHMEWFWRYVGSNVKIEKVPFFAVYWVINTSQNVSGSAYTSKYWPDYNLDTGKLKRTLKNSTKFIYQYTRQLFHAALVKKSFKDKKLYFSVSDLMSKKH